MKKWLARLALVLAIAGSIIGITAVAANAYQWYYGCVPGNGCVWTDINGGGTRLTFSVSWAGYNTCHNLPAAQDDAVSSASSDYGGGWDLKLFRDYNCSLSNFHDYILHSSVFANFNGANCLIICYNDQFSSFRIEQDY